MCLCVHTYVCVCVCVRVCACMCMCGDQVVFMITCWLWWADSLFLPAYSSSQSQYQCCIYCSPTGTVCTYRTLYSSGGAQLPSQLLGLEVMLGHAPVAGLLESGGRSTCVQQSSRGVCPLCWTSVHCSLATI